MKLFFTVTLLLVIHSLLFSQNVGIGNPAPAEKLDVNGNINLTGTIKANGVSGQPGEVLRTNNSGILEWGSLCQYENTYTIGFTSSGAVQQWTVPDTVIKVVVEFWGGGGRGHTGNTSLAYGAGGGGGSYCRVLLNVTPGSTISMVVGGGGGNGSLVASGQETTVNYGPYSYFAFGGLVGDSYGGNGGSFTGNNPLKNWVGVNGEAGHVNSIRFDQASATNFVKTWMLGRGGNGGNTSNTSGPGGTFSLNLTTFLAEYDVKGKNGLTPGGGGSGSLGDPNNWGGTGMVRIHF